MHWKFGAPERVLLAIDVNSSRSCMFLVPICKQQAFQDVIFAFVYERWHHIGTRIEDNSDVA